MTLCRIGRLVVFGMLSVTATACRSYGASPTPPVFVAPAPAPTQLAVIGVAPIPATDQSIQDLSLAIKAQTKKAADDAQKAADDAQKAADDHDWNTKNLRDGKLIGYGVTAGVAFALHTPLPATHRQQSASFSAMPYVAVFPRRFFVEGDITRRYCESRFLAGDARGDANHLAEVEARRLLEERKNGTNIPLYGLFNGERQFIRPGDAQYKATNDLVGQASAGGFPKEDDAEARRWLVWTLTSWDERLAGSCGWFAWLGAYFGIPASFTVNALAADNDKAIASRQFSPYASVGIAVAPTALVSALAGVTFSSVKGDDNINHTVPSLTFGIGGNLDIVGLLFK